VLLAQVFIAAGTIILWVGFYGFNGGSVQPPWAAAPGVGGGGGPRVRQHHALCLLLGVTVWTLTNRREPAPEDTFNGVIGRPRGGLRHQQRGGASSPPCSSVSTRAGPAAVPGCWERGAGSLGPLGTGIMGLMCAVFPQGC